MAKHVLLLLIVATASLVGAFAFQPLPLQDFCVAEVVQGKVTGKCKDPATVKADDFYNAGSLGKAGNTSNPLRVALNFLSIDKIPGIFTQDILIGRVDYAPNGFVPPHYHHKGAEIITVLQGSLEVGFVSSFPNFVLYNKTLGKGDVFVVPQGLLHYQRNAGKENVVSIFASNSNNQGVVTVTGAIFGAKPEINTDYLAAAFTLDKKIIQDLQNKF